MHLVFTKQFPRELEPCPLEKEVCSELKYLHNAGEGEQLVCSLSETFLSIDWLNGDPLASEGLLLKLALHLFLQNVK